jgi:hypothetical protein
MSMLVIVGDGSEQMPNAGDGRQSVMAEREYMEVTAKQLLAWMEVLHTRDVPQ